MKPRVRYLQAPTGPDRSEGSLDTSWSKAGEEEEQGIEEGQESRLMGTVSTMFVSWTSTAT